MILEIENNYNTKLEVNLVEHRGYTPRITIKDIRGVGEKNFLLNPDQVEQLKRFFVGEWVELVKKEDLEDMLECVKSCCIQAQKTANAAVETANRLSEIYQRYSNSVSKEAENENKT